MGKKTKKLFALLLVCCMVVSLLPAYAFAEEEAEEEIIVEVEAPEGIAGIPNVAEEEIPVEEEEIEEEELEAPAPEPQEFYVSAPHVVAASDNAHLGYVSALYSDWYFLESSHEYSHDLAVLSLAASMAAMTMTDNDKPVGGDSYVRTFLSDIGCDDELTFTYRFETNSSTDDVSAYAFGVKQVCEDTFLIPVLVRGFGYGGEWASNCRAYDPGYGDYGAGFKKPEELLFNDLMDYLDALEEAGISRENMKLWVVGYSRAASIANLLGGDLNAYSDVDTDNIFVYTFEAPAGIRVGSAMYTDETNIYNIVSESDIVPRVLLESWGFGLNGVTLYLPCASVSGSAFSSALPQVKSTFKDIMNGAGCSTSYAIIDKQENVIDLLLDYLDNYITSERAYGNDGWQSIIVSFMENNYADVSDPMVIFEIIRTVIAGASPTFADNFVSFLKDFNKLSSTQRYNRICTLAKQAKSVAKGNTPGGRIIKMLLEIFVDYQRLFCLGFLSLSYTTGTYDAMFSMIGDIVVSGTGCKLLVQHWPQAVYAWMTADGVADALRVESHARLQAQKVTKGDVNGDGNVNAADLLLLKLKVAGFKNKINTANADMNGDGKINTKDVTLLTKYIAKLVF